MRAPAQCNANVSQVLHSSPIEINEAAASAARCCAAAMLRCTALLHACLLLATAAAEVCLNLKMLKLEAEMQSSNIHQIHLS